MQRKNSFHSRSTRQAGRGSDGDLSYDSTASRPGAVSVASNGSGRLVS